MCCVFTALFISQNLLFSGGEQASRGCPLTGRRPGASSSIHYILVSEGLSARVSARPCFAYVHYKEVC